VFLLKTKISIKQVKDINLILRVQKLNPFMICLSIDNLATGIFIFPVGSVLRYITILTIQDAFSCTYFSHIESFYIVKLKNKFGLFP